MPRSPSFKVTKTDKGWRLNIPAGISDTGKPQRLFFRTRDLALTEAQRVRGDFRSNGEKATVLPPRVAGDALRAWSILEPLGMSLTDAAKIVAEIEESKSRSETVAHATEIFLLTKESASDSQHKAYRVAFVALCDDFGGRKLNTITGSELEAHIERKTGGPGAANQRMRLLKALWRWAAKPQRKWCETEAVEHFETREVIHGGVKVLTAEQAEALLRAAENHYPETVPAFAIALFTGMRKQEIERLQPEDVSDDGLSVPATSAKTKRRRFIQMSEPLAAWLKAYPIGDTVTPSGWVRKEKAVRRLAGWKVWAEYVEPQEPPEDLPLWPDNALRHTAATVALAIGKPIETLVFEHGHSGGLTTLQRHYIGVMPKSEAEKIWALRPEGRGESRYI